MLAARAAAAAPPNAHKGARTRRWICCERLTVRRYVILLDFGSPSSETAGMWMICDAPGERGDRTLLIC